MLRPPFLKGETLKKVVHAYLLRDGKSVNAVLPAEGHLFLTMYRVIFLGTPCNHGSQNKVAIKSVSLHSLFKVKESTSCTILCEGRSISIPKVVQLRTLTSQLLKFGFEDSASGSHMISKVIQLRYPEQVKIGLPLKDSENLRDHQKPRPSFKRTRSRNQSMDYDASAISCLSQSYYCKEYSRMQLGTLNVKGSGNGQWRVSKLNMGYSVCSSYPCVVAIPEKLADQTLLGVASQFLENRFPAASWRNQSNGATLLRSSSFNYKVPKQTATVGPDHLDDNKDDKRIYGIYSAEVESMIKSIIDVTPSSWTPSTCDSLTKGVEPKSVAIAFDHPSDCEEDNEETTESVDDLLLDKEPGSHGFGVHDVLSDSGDEDDQKQQTDIDSSSLSHPEDKIVMKFSSIPTNPVDWVTVDLLPDAIRLWKHSPLYVIGDKDRFKNIPKETYSGCTFVPVEVPDIQCVMASFRKLTRACCPSSQKQQQSTFLSDVENSHWIDHLSTLLQLSVAIADLIHIQGSSVLVALEKGMDVTAQVVSLAQIILDPFYRTIEGFCHLVEKDWLAFGHPFTKRNNQLLGSALKHDLSPIFLQFLDCIHQVLTQCPSSFEFNDCFLKTVAFHYSSSRFHTFCLNCENERVEYGWCEYRQSQEAADGEEISSFWDYILTVDKNLPVFFNPFYDSTSNLGVLQIQSYQANLDIWSFYTEEYLARFPKYDFELYSCSDLTVQDIQNELFDTSEVKPLSSTDVAANYLELYLLKYIALLRSIARNHNASWRNIWEDLSAPIDDQFSSVSHTQFTKGCLDGEQDVIKMHKNTLHRQTSLAVLMKTHLSVELRDNFNKPHCFIPHTLKSSVMCDFCKHKISAKQAHKCTQCSKLCHGYCKQLMPSNCGVKNHVSHQDSSTGVEDAFRMRQGSSTFYIETERASHIYEGHLFKKGYFVKNWKQRWFVLDSEKGEVCEFECTIVLFDSVYKSCLLYFCFSYAALIL
jgi:myotubularin-related protein 5/13